MLDASAGCVVYFEKENKINKHFHNENVIIFCQRSELKFKSDKYQLIIITSSEIQEIDLFWSSDDNDIRDRATLTEHSLITEQSQSQIWKPQNEMEFFRMTFWFYEDFAK